MDREGDIDGVAGALVAGTAARERRLLAADLHDTLGQDLWSLGLALDELVGDLPAHLVDRVQGLAEGLANTRRELRCRLQRLRSSALEGRSVGQALGELDRELRSRGAAGLAVHVARPERRTAPAVEDQLWCIALEAVANALRHGEQVPTEVDLRVGADGSASLVVANLCRPEPAVGPGPGSGLRSRSGPGSGDGAGPRVGEGMGSSTMAARARAIGGVLRAGRADPERWEVRAWSPAPGAGSATQQRLPLEAPAA